MAVYTHLDDRQLAGLVDAFDVGTLVSAKGIAEGVSNSNWLVETSAGRFILTMYERRIETGDLPFFLGLLDHLAAKGCPVPRTIHDRDGQPFRMLGDKAVALIEFLPGVSVDHPDAAQAHNLGAVLAQIHLKAMDFAGHRDNDLGPGTSARVLAECGTEALGGIDRRLPAAIAEAERIAREWPNDLPGSVIHADLFPDNVLMLGAKVTGLIDFYFACNDAMAYDLMVTHAAWSFERGGVEYREDVGPALIAGYESVRPLEPGERAALPLLAQGACMRFLSSRAYDWLHTPADALVTRKDPMAFARRLDFYAARGDAAFEG
jgi:homoserine kinase type II